MTSHIEGLGQQGLRSGAKTCPHIPNRLLGLGLAQANSVRRALPIRLDGGRESDAANPRRCDSARATTTCDALYSAELAAD